MASARSRWMVAGLVGIAGIAFGLGACAHSNSADNSALGNPDPGDVNAFQAPVHSGIISDYSRLKPSTEFPGTLSWSSGKLKNYDKFIVEPVLIVPSQSTRGIAISEKEKQRLSADFRYDLVDVLQATHKVIVVPAPRTARIRVAVTQIARSASPELKWFRWEGGAAAEMEITDSLTNEPLASVIDSEMVKRKEDSPVKDAYGDAKLVFRHWAARLGKWLISAQ